MPLSFSILAKTLQPVFQCYPEIKLVYYFGSKAQDKGGPLSDYDFAFYLNETNKRRIFEIKMELIGQITRFLRTDNVDVVILNTAEKPELKYNIIQEGKIIFEQEPFRVVVEPKILHEYFDFKSMLARYNLTKS